MFQRKSFIKTFVLVPIVIFVFWSIMNSISIIYERETNHGFYEDAHIYPFFLLSGFIYCEFPEQCDHEIGHLANYEYGYPSQSPEFEKVINELYTFCILENPYDFGLEHSCDHLITFPGLFGNDYKKVSGKDWGGMHELYSSLYAKYKNRWVIPYDVIDFFYPAWKE